MLKYIAFAALAGFFLPLQALINARTSQVLGGAFWATLVNFAGGTVFALLILAALRTPVPSLDQVAPRAVLWLDHGSVRHHVRGPGGVHRSANSGRPR